MKLRSRKEKDRGEASEVKGRDWGGLGLGLWA